MRYEDASGSISSQGSGVTDARDDADALPAGSHGPATGNTITGEGTITGAAGADIVDHGPGKIVALEGASGSDSAEDGSMHVDGRFGEITMDSRGGYSYTAHDAKPQGGSDVFRYTLADADGERDTATLTIDIGREIEKIDANAQQLVPGPDGVITLPPGVELSDIMVVGRNLVINMPDGTQMVIIDGAVFVPQLVLNGVEVPATNLASLLIDAEPQPAAGTPTSSGGNFAVDVPPLDPGVPLGDLIPPTELVFTPPVFQDIGQFEDDEPEIFVQPDGQPASVAAVDSVNEAGLPTRNGGEPAGSGESADGNSSDNDDSSETTTGNILIDADDDPAVVSINGIAVTSVGQVIAGAFGNLTITSISDTVIGYSYTLRDNTSGNTTHDDFSVTVEDNDGDTATATLTIDIVDDVPTARNDTDSVTTLVPTTTGNVITSVGTTNSPAGADTVGADNASLTAVSGAGGSDSSFNEGGNLVVAGSLGTLTINASGGYTYVAGPDSPGGTDVFTYTLTDGDGDTSTATLTITVPADLRPTLDVPTAGEAGTLVDEAGLPPRSGEPAGSGESADGLPNNESDDSEITNGTINFTQGDTPATVRIDGVVVTGTVGQTFAGDHGTLTITGYNAATGTITYSYTLTDNTSGDNTDDSFAVTVTDSDGDVASGTLTIDIIDDVPTARPDTDVVAAGTFGPATGNVITDAAAGDAGDGDNGADTVGADDAVVTLVSSVNVPANSDNSGPFVVNGQYGVLTLQTDGNYSYVRNEGTPGGVTEVFNYTITDGDGDTSSSTLTITIENAPVIVGQNPTVLSDDDAVPGAGGNPGGPEDDVDAANLTGTLSGSGGDGALTFDLLTTGAPAGFTYVDGPAGSILVQQVQDGSTVTVLTITVNAATGAYTVTQNAPIEHPSLDGQPGDDTENNVPFTINYTVTDLDGSSAAGTLNINVDDDTPEALIRVQVGGTVDEDGLAGGNAGGVNDVPGENTVVNGNVSALFSPGADQPLTYSLLSDTSGLPALTSNGAPVTYSVSGNTLTASANGGPVFTLVLNAGTGAYTFTLLDQLDHPSLDNLPGDDTENPADSDLTIQLGSIIQATDSDGDSVTADANGLNIVVDDDSPQEFVECPAGITINNPGSTFTGDLNLPPVGADQPGTVSFVVTDGDPVMSGGEAVTSNGQPLFYFVNSEGVLEARVGDATGDVVFTVTLNDNGTFTYDQIGPLGEGGGTSFNDLTSTGGGNAEFRGIGADDPATTVDILLSGEAAGADATVNTDSDSIGTANQSMDVGETIRIDFVSDLTTGGGTPSGFSYSGHVSSNSFIEAIPQVQGNQAETVAFTVWALDSTNTAAVEPDRNPTGSFSDSTITPITEVTVKDYLSGDTTSAAVTFSDGTTFVNVAYGISVRVNADGSVTFAGVQQGDSYGISTGAGGDFNAIAVQAEPAGTGGSTEDSFDLGVFSIGTETVITPIDLSIPIALTDSDGDSVVCDIDLVIGPPVEAPDVTLTVNEAGLPVIGSDAPAASESDTIELQGLVTGGTGPYTFVLDGSGNGLYGTLTIDTDGTATYVLDTPFDTQPSVNDGTNPELGAEAFSFVATDSLGATQTGTVTINIIDDVPMVDVTTDPESGVVLLTQDAETIGAAVSDTASSSADFGDVFELAFVAGADGAAGTPALAYALGVSAPGVNSGLDQGGADIFLYVIGTKVVGSTSATSGGVLPANTVFDVSVNSSGVVTLTQYSQIDHPIANAIVNMADGLVTLTASSTITDNDGDTDVDSAMIGIGNNLQFADDGPLATNDVDAIAAGFFGTATGNVMTGVEVAVAEDTNSSDGVADNVGADVPGRISSVSFTSDGGGAPVVQAISAGGSTIINGDYGVLTLYSNGDYSYDRNEGSAGGVNDVFTYTLRDFDGDTTTATLTINIAVNPPVATTASAAVDDDGLSGANAAGSNDIDANTQPTPDDLDGALSSEASFRGQLGVTGGDGDIDFSLIAPANQTIGQETVSYSLVANVLTATIATSPDATRVGDPLFTVTLNAETGEYVVNLVDNVLHGDDANNDEDGIEVSVNIPYQVVDASLNTSAANGTLNIVFNDDVPTATNDVASQATENVAFTINALANDVFGADGVNIDSASKVFVSTQATQGVVTYSTTTHLFTYTPNADAGSTSTADSFTYKIIDADGDESTATVSITLQPDSTPQVVNVVAAVDDDGLVGSPDGVLEAGNGDINANTGEPGATASEAVYTGQLTVNFGADTGTVDFSNLNGTFGQVGTERVQYSWSGTTLTATVTHFAANGTTVQAREGTALFTVSLSPSGAYTVTLLDNVLHASGGNDETSAPVVDLNYRAIESGSFDPVTTGKLSITFNDDMPRAIQPDDITTGLENEAGATATADLDDDLVSEVITDFGADGPGLVTFANIANGDNSGLTSGGDEIDYYLTNNGQTLEGRTNSTDGTDGEVVFTVQINQAGGTYTFTLNDPLDNGSGVTFSDLSGGVAGNPPFKLITEAGVVTELLATPIGTTSVNSDSDDIAVGSQFIEFNDGIRFDFGDFTYINQGGSTNDDAFQITDNSNPINGFKFTIDQVSNGTTADFKLSAIDADNDGHASESNIAADVDDVVDHITRVVVLDNNGALVAEFTGTDTTTYSFDVTFNGDGTVNFDGLPAQYSVQTYTADGYNRLVIFNDGTAAPDGKFSISELSIAVVDNGDPIHLTYDLQITDADGDTVPVPSAIDITIDPADSTTTATFASTALVTKEALGDSDTSSFSLMSSDSVDQQRTMSAANNNSVLLGAIAAAGLGVSSAAAAQGFAQSGNHQVLDTSSFHQDGAALSGLAVDHSESANKGIGGDAHEDMRGNDNANESSAQQQVVEKLSLTDDNHEQGQAPTELLQGTEHSGASDAAQSNLTSAGVAMPSAEMLAGGNSNDNAAAGQAQGASEVAQALHDALAGGGHGPDIDAVIEAVANQGQGRDAAALEALASHGAVDVSAWHMAGFGGFPGGHGAAMEPMLHHDAVIVAS